jgi:lactobin A/cerein 7B family class IIb bacteriocin
MKNLNLLNVKELTDEELVNTEGGIGPLAIALAIALTVGVCGSLK